MLPCRCRPCRCRTGKFASKAEEAAQSVAPTLKGLAGTWAADQQYAVTLARVANEIRTHGS